jgi:hypothetical protein
LLAFPLWRTATERRRARRLRDRLLPRGRREPEISWESIDAEELLGLIGLEQGPPAEVVSLDAVRVERGRLEPGDG